MKRILFILSLIFTTASCFAQNYTFGIKGGVNFSHQGVFYSSAAPDVRTLVGYHVGGVLDIGFKSFSIQPGILFSTKGNKESVDIFALGKPTFTTTKLNYIEVPVNLLYKFNAGQALKVFIGGGPYAAYGLSGGWYVSGQKLGSIVFGGDDNYKRFDYGVNFTAGFEVKKLILVGASYGLGADLYPNATKLKNHVLGLSVGYLFKK
jgi:hypothetical protein